MIAMLPFIPFWLRSRWGLLAALATVWVLIFTIWASIGLGGAELKALVSNIAFLPLSLFAAIAAFRVTTDNLLPTTIRKGWLFLGLAVLSYFFGDFIWFFMESVLKLPLAESLYTWSDIFYVAFYPLAVAGLISLPTSPLKPGERLKFWFDLFIVLTAAWMLVWYLVIQPAVLKNDNLIAQWLAVAYPAGDFVILGCVVALLFRRPDDRARTALLLFMGGLIAFVGADLVYAYWRLAGEYETGGWLDSGWALAYLLFALAAIRQRYHGVITEQHQVTVKTLNKLSLILPFVAIAVGYGLLLLIAGDQWRGDIRLQVELYAGGLLTALVMARQTLVLRENFQLNAQLKKQYELLQIEQDKSERLLLNILPGSIAERLKQSSETIADSFAEVTVLFADVVGFTPLSAQYKPEQLVRLLNELFSAFDVLAEAHGLEKIKTIGDAYMAVSGLPVANLHHARVAASMAIDMHKAAQIISEQWGVSLQLRIGLNTGPVVAGVIGQKKFIYDLWGDTVNIASRMESHGMPGYTQVTQAVYDLLRDQFVLERRGPVHIKGKGEMQTYFLISRLTSPAN